MSTIQQDVDERTSLTGNNKFELFLFRLGTSEHSTQRELFGINVFKVREIMEMPEVTAVAGSHPHILGVVNIRGQIVPVIDLPTACGCKASKLRILMVTEFARSTQAFAVEEVDEIVRLEWSQVLSAENSVGGGLITSIARIDGNVDNTRLAQVLDVEQILRNVMPSDTPDIEKGGLGPTMMLAPGAVILAADDSSLARSLIEKGLEAMGVPYIMTKTGMEAWQRLNLMTEQAKAEGKTIQDKVALVLTDLEMPEMDGFTLTRNIKTDPRFAGIPVVIHSSLTGATNEDHVRGVGADAYVAKFVAAELAATIRKVLTK
jgi:two-component system chemotaxis response regulator CheV